MVKTSSQFKFLRCLILCVGFIASPSSVMAQIAMLQPNELSDEQNTDYGANSVEVEEISPSDRTLTNSKQLTFEFINPQSTKSTNTNTAVTAKPENPDSTVISQQNTDQQKVTEQKKSKKKNKKFKKGKAFKKYCSLFFEGTVTRGSEFTARGNFSSGTLIQVFDNEAAYLSGSSALQTIEYSTASTEVVSVGDQIGSVTVKTTQSRQLTFQYLSRTDTNYTDVVITQKKKGYGAVSGIVDADNESYIVISDGRRGKKCKKFKRIKTCKKGTNLFIQGNIAAGGNFLEPIDCSSNTLIQIFNDAPDFIFTDVRKSYWASRFIHRLSFLEIIDGFSDGSFRPEGSVTQAQFAAIVSRAFNVARVRQVTVINNISRDYWAYGELETAYSMGFIDITSSTFNVEQRLTKLDVLISIAKGLGYTKVTSGRSVNTILSVFTDANTIPTSDRVYIAALVEKGILVNYPNVNTLNINRVISRAETCALVHQSLVSLGQLEGIRSNYIPR